MSNNSILLKDENIYYKSKLKNTLIIGFLLRIFMLIFILFVGTEFARPYFLTDDIKYENLAKYYMINANGVFDFDLFDRMTIGYAEQFWPLVECISAKLFNNIYAGRIINIILSTGSISVIYKLTLEVSNNNATALKAARLFAYLPVSVLTCCFAIKDIYLTFSVMYAFYLFVRLQSGRRITVQQIIFCVGLLVGVSFTRGAVVELLLMFLLIYYLQRLFREKKQGTAVMVLLFALLVFAVFHKSILASFQTKIDDYSGYADTGEGINFIKVTGLSNIYKLPLAYAFATLQPLKLDLLEVGDNVWLTIMSYANITIYPIAIGNFLYMFFKKHNLFFWLSSFVMYSAVIILSLGIFRHYLFLLPIEMINYSLYTQDDQESNTIISMLGAVALFLIIAFCSALNIF